LVLNRGEERTERRATHIAKLRKRATEADAKLKRLYDAIENGVTDLSDLMLKDRITELKAIRDQARADAERAEGAIDRLGQPSLPDRSRPLPGPHASECAPRTAATGAIISARSPSASKSTRKNFALRDRKANCCAHPCRRFKRKNGEFWRAQFCTEVARPERLEHPPQLSIQVVNWDGLRRNIADGDERSALRITIESSRRTQLRRFHAATFLLPLPRHFHERNLKPKSGQQKALENGVISRACCLVAGIGFEPMTFRL
jgi:hypothetical protein